MFYSKLKEASLFKKIIEAIKDLINEVNINIDDSGLMMQAMDSSHVALVGLFLSSEGFEEYRCDKNTVLGINISNLWKILKFITADDSLVLNNDDCSNQINIILENKSIILNK